MNYAFQIPEPFLFNPLKHHLGYIREFMNFKNVDDSDNNINTLINDIKHIGNSVMDVYSGNLSVSEICSEVEEILEQKRILEREPFSTWTGINRNDLRIVAISDASQWTLKFHSSKLRFIHIFPARNSKSSFRVKSNTLKSALLYNIMIGKDFITGDDLNNVRSLLLLPPIKDIIDTEGITEMIEILRD